MEMFKGMPVVTTNKHNDKTIVITEMVPLVDPPIYFWFVCNNKLEVLSDNTKGFGEDTFGEDAEESAISNAKNVIDRFL